MKSIYIWGANEAGKAVKGCIDGEKNRVAGFIDNSPKLQGKTIEGSFVFSFDEIENDSSVCIVIALLKRHREVVDQILAGGFAREQIIAFFDTLDADRYDSDVFRSKAACLEACRVLEGERQEREEKGSWYEVERELQALQREPTDKKIVVIGKNEYSERFIDGLHRLSVTFWGQIPFDGEAEQAGNCLEDLLYENPEELKIYIIAPRKTRKIEGRLLDLGLSAFQSLGETQLSGTRMQDVYDPNVGYTWMEGDLPGFVHFRAEHRGGEKTFRIVTLGGSTTDATQVNIKSWSEYLFEMCRSLDGVNVEVFAGGMGGYVCTQEMRKLIRDVLELKPDLVISYSGGNDAFADYYYEKDHPMCLKFEADYARRAVEDNRICNTFMYMTPIHSYTFGLETAGSIAQHWVRCERIMHAVCEEFGIKFYGFLQPCRPKEAISYASREQIDGMEQFFEQARGLIGTLPENDYLIDFTGIFEGRDNVYYDAWHVYEQGNRIIAGRMMPYVLEHIGGR